MCSWIGIFVKFFVFIFCMIATSQMTSVFLSSISYSVILNLMHIFMQVGWWKCSFFVSIQAVTGRWKGTRILWSSQFWSLEVQTSLKIECWFKFDIYDSITASGKYDPFDVSWTALQLLKVYVCGWKPSVIVNYFRIFWVIKLQGPVCIR
jgi:hypothetical protein